MIPEIVDQPMIVDLTEAATVPLPSAPRAIVPSQGMPTGLSPIQLYNPSEGTPSQIVLQQRTQTMMVSPVSPASIFSGPYANIANQSTTSDDTPEKAMLRSTNRNLIQQLQNAESAVRQTE